MEEQQPIEINDKEMVDFIQNALLEKGIIVSGNDILTILDLEMEYMVKIGVAVPMDSE